MEFIYKKLCTNSYMFKLQSPSKYSLFETHYRDVFSTAHNSSWTHPFWCLWVLLLVFVSPLPHWQNVSLWGLFSFRKTKKGCLGVRTGGWGMGVMPSGGKSCWTLSTVWAGVLVNHPSWNGPTHWKSLQKNPLKPNTASQNTTSWHTDTDGFLEHSSSGEACTTRGLPSRR